MGISRVRLGSNRLRKGGEPEANKLIRRELHRPLRRLLERGESLVSFASAQLGRGNLGDADRALFRYVFLLLQSFLCVYTFHRVRIHARFGLDIPANAVKGDQKQVAKI